MPASLARDMARDMARDIVLVVAVADNGVIGNGGTMPWHAPEDLRRFKRLTMGHPVIMGRKTCESIGRPLPGRHNIVLSRSGWRMAGVTTVGSMEEALAAAGGAADEGGAIMVIGGADLFAQWLPLATRAEVTRLHISPPGDTLWAPLAPQHWILAAVEPHPEASPAMTFESWRRLRPAVQAEPGRQG